MPDSLLSEEFEPGNVVQIHCAGCRFGSRQYWCYRLDGVQCVVASEEEKKQLGGPFSNSSAEIGTYVLVDPTVWVQRGVTITPCVFPCLQVEHISSPGFTEFSYYGERD